MKCIKLWLTIVQIFHRKRVLFPNWTSDLCGRVYHKSNFDYIIQSFSKAYNWIKSRHSSWSYLVIILTQDVCCLKVSQTSNTRDCRINHRSRTGLRAVWSIRQTLGLVMAHASCNLICGISFMSFGVIQRQNPLEFMTCSQNFNLRHSMRKLVFRDVRAGQTQVFHVRHFGNYLS